ncbi:NUDIX domain-containing protein [Gracilimonas halophila]|uniref:NUDIX domain-containing protein n=1 Tax=Gracilimonas halophila TaxID=1834464 RepID=A0ABW5JMD3_9BACT
MTEGQYSGKLRVRSCGLLFEKDKILLVELKSPITNQWTWMPPGGGVEFGESLEEALTREFLEETGLKVDVQKQVQIHELIEPPIHAIEFYYLVERMSGDIQLGADPEMLKQHQILRDIGFFSKDEIEDLNIKPDFLRRISWESFC